MTCLSAIYQGRVAGTLLISDVQSQSQDVIFSIIGDAAMTMVVAWHDLAHEHN